MTDHEPTERFDSEEVERLADLVTVMLARGRTPRGGLRPEIRARLLATVAARLERPSHAA